MWTPSPCRPPDLLAHLVGSRVSPASVPPQGLCMCCYLLLKHPFSSSGWSFSSSRSYPSRHLPERPTSTTFVTTFFRAYTAICHCLVFMCSFYVPQHEYKLGEGRGLVCLFQPHNSRISAMHLISIYWQLINLLNISYVSGTEY